MNQSSIHNKATVSKESPEEGHSIFLPLVILLVGGYALYFGYSALWGTGHYLYTQRAPEKLEAALSKNFGQDLRSRGIKKVYVESRMTGVYTTIDTDSTSQEWKEGNDYKVENHMLYANNEGDIKIYWNFEENKSFDDILKKSSAMINDTLDLYDEGANNKRTWEYTHDARELGANESD